MISGLDYFRELNIASVLLRLVLAMAFGGMIGLERGRKHRAAGFRTYMLVCLGSALTSILSQYLFVQLSTVWAEIAVTTGKQVDVSRLGAKVYSGIGFLAAGTIIVTGRQEVKGMTTAAGLWASACMGIAIGAGFYECVILAFLLIFVAIRVLRPLESYITESARNINLYVEFDSLDNLGEIIGRIKSQDVQIYDVDLDRGEADRAKFPSAVFSMRLGHRQPHTQVMASIAELSCVQTIDEV